MRKTILFAVIFAGLSFTGHAQTEHKRLSEREKVNLMENFEPTQAQLDSAREAQGIRAVSRTAAYMDSDPRMYYVPYYTGMPVWGGYQWDLHKGMNVNVSASAFATTGNHDYFPGSGFSTDVSALYVAPLSKKLTVAVGLYGSQNNFGRYGSFNDFGLQGIVNYQYNDRLNLSAYGRLSFINPKIPYPLRAMYPLMRTQSTFGANLDYKISNSVSVHVGVRGDKY